MIARLERLRPGWILAALIVLSTSAMALAMRRTSTTFDEVVLIAAGARGFTNGKFDLAPDHPPMMQYVYGLPAYLAQPHYPPESGRTTHERGYRYVYARQFFWESGNDPIRFAFLGRMAAPLIALLLVLATYLFTRGAAGTRAALMAATLVAFLPDVLAHGGVAYNDLPLALTYLLGVWALDRMLRAPTWQTAVVAGAAVGLALGVKMSAVALAPAAVALLALEIIRRGRDVRWIVRVAPAILLAMAAAYLMIALIFRGDFTLAQFRYALGFTFQHVTEGHGAAGFLLGRLDPRGFWYFFPVAFLFKTSAALHILLIIALVAVLKADYPDFRAMAGHPLRVPAVGFAVFVAALLTSRLDIGFRYALPALPHLCILIAAGVAYMWRTAGQRLRYIILVLFVWAMVSPLTWYPNFLAYISEYGPGRDRGSEVLVDSSLDWGQGLLQLRDYLRAHHIDRVYLSYFGSAEPDGYGIDYEPLASFFPLQPSRLRRPDAPPPKYIVISATNLQGTYIPGDRFGGFRHERLLLDNRRVTLQDVVAHTMYVYRIGD